MRKEYEPEPKSPKELLHEQILGVLESNAALCMDVQEERYLLADKLTELLIGEGGRGNLAFKTDAG